MTSLKDTFVIREGAIQSSAARIKKIIDSKVADAERAYAKKDFAAATNSIRDLATITNGMLLSLANDLIGGNVK